MKIRNGFVSNSSSASYLVKIHDISIDEFANKIFGEYGWTEFSPNQILAIIKEDLITLEKSIEKYDGSKAENDKQKAFEDFLSNSYKKQLEKLKSLEEYAIELVEQSEKDNVVLDLVKAVKFVFEYYQIRLEEHHDGILLGYFTSMHNSFNEGMSGVMKEIVLYFLFDTDYQVTCMRDDDSGYGFDI